MYCGVPRDFIRNMGKISTVFSSLPLCVCVMQVAPLAADGPHASWLTNKRWVTLPVSTTMHKGCRDESNYINTAVILCS